MCTFPVVTPQPKSSTQEAELEDIIYAAKQRRAKLSRIGAALLKHIEKFDDVLRNTPASLPQREDL